MFKKLKDNIGKNVIVKYWKDNRIVIQELKLKYVKNYRYMLFDENDCIYFIAHNGAVISVVGEDQEILYKCENFADNFELEKDISIAKTHLIEEGIILLPKELANDWENYVNIQYGKGTKKITILLNIIKISQEEGQEFVLRYLDAYMREFDSMDKEELLEALAYFGNIPGKQTSPEENYKNNILKKQIVMTSKIRAIV